MKFLEYTEILDRFNNFLDPLNLGDRTIKGCLEAYSCKHVKSDKKLSLSLENEILDYLGKSAEDSPSPVDCLLSRSTRKTLVYLVLTLYQMFPKADCDFRAVKAHEFLFEESWNTVKQIFNDHMFEASRIWSQNNEDGPLIDAIYKALDEVVKLAECEIYVYNPKPEADPFADDMPLWSFCFFFHNRKQKRVVGFRCCCISNLGHRGNADALLPSGSGSDGGDEEIFNDMDI